jgi:pyruvate/2-oxoglutarate dehydrogenase complex dihydrolipoamide dehydrogenase (E3) component
MELDVIVIGSGQAGVPLAVKLAGAGKRVALVERGELGGTCINTGCTPTKTMIASSRAAHVARTAGRLGVRVPEVSVDLAAVVRRKNDVVASWRESIERRIEAAGERLLLLRGHARFVAERTVEVDGERYRAEVVVINTGARPAVPPLAGLETVVWLDNRRLMELETLPEHLLVLGGGYVGSELAQLYRRLGALVTIVDRAPHLLSQEDPEVSAVLEEVFAGERIGLELGASVEGVEQRSAGVAVRLSGGRDLRGSHLLVATGRRPNTDDLGCEAGGVPLDERGFVIIDDRYQTSAHGVYAVGDASGEPQFTHVSWDDHRILFDLLTGRSQRDRRGRLTPHVAFTDPQVAGVGLTETAARARGVPFEVASYPFGSIARALEVDEPAGLLKVLIEPESERVLGATIVGAEAGELLHVFVALMQAGGSARAIVDAQFVHPTFAEGVQSVVMGLERFSAL